MGCEYGCDNWARSLVFDAIVTDETNFRVSLDDLVGNHVGGYLEPAEDGESAFVRLDAPVGVGVYILWRKYAYCSVHDSEVYLAAYVGKTGTSFASRLDSHFLRRSVGRGFQVEITVWPSSNRQAKYVEQLLLDRFAFEANRAENGGTELLTIPTPGDEWDLHTD